MAGSHLAGGAHSSYSGRPQKQRRSGGSKIWILILALIIIIAVVGYFVATNVFGIDLLGTASSDAGNVIGTTTITVQDARGSDVTSKVSIEQSTFIPTELDSASSIGVSLGWDSLLSGNYPMIITVADDSFENDDGLTVYQYSSGQWEELGTYVIADHAVSFRAETLTYFAFATLSSQATPTPELTATPEPTAEPIVSEEPEIDYGMYDVQQTGMFVQVTGISEGGSYVIAILDDSNSTDTTAEEAELTGTVLLHYDADTLSTVDVTVKQTSSGRYYIDTACPVVAGMLWNAESSDEVNNGDTRFSLVNNGAYLNLNEDSTAIVMDDNADRTRWLYSTQAIAETAEDGEAETETEETAENYNGLLSYYNDATMYYILSAVAETAEDEGSADQLTLSVTTESGQALIIALFRVNTEADTDTETTEDAEEAEEEDTDSTSTSNSTLVLTSTPSAISGINATPRANNTTTTTVTPTPNSVMVPVDDDEDVTTPPPATAEATAAPTAAPTAVPAEVTTNPTAVPSNPSSSTDSGTTDSENNEEAATH